MKGKKLIRSCMALLFLCSFGRAHAQPTYKAMLSPNILGNGVTVGPAGTYVAGTTGSPIQHAGIWQLGEPGPIDLHPNGFANSRADGADGNSQVGSAFQSACFCQHAILWHSSANTAVDLHPAGFIISLALGVSGNSQVGHASTSSAQHAILWHGNPASAIDLNPAGFAESAAVGASGDIQVGWGHNSTFANRDHALLWKGTAASAVDLNPIGFDGSQASAAAGSVQVGSAFGSATGGHSHAFLWNGTPESGVDLNPVGFFQSIANGAAANTQVGSGYHFSLEEHALAWNGTALSAIDLHPFLAELPFTLYRSRALAVANNGVIAGTAEDLNGRFHGVIWVPIPEPNSFELLMCGIAGMTKLTRRIRDQVHRTIRVPLLPSTAAANWLT